MFSITLKHTHIHTPPLEKITYYSDSTHTPFEFGFQCTIYVLPSSNKSSNDSICSPIPKSPSSYSKLLYQMHVQNLAEAAHKGNDQAQLAHDKIAGLIIKPF